MRRDRKRRKKSGARKKCSIPFHLHAAACKWRNGHNVSTYQQRHYTRILSRFVHLETRVSGKRAEPRPSPGFQSLYATIHKYFFVFDVIAIPATQFSLSFYRAPVQPVPPRESCVIDESCRAFDVRIRTVQRSTIFQRFLLTWAISEGFVLNRR